MSAILWYTYVEIIFTDPIIKSREVCAKFFEFVDQVIYYFHIDTIELVVLDQWRKATIIVCISIMYMYVVNYMYMYGGEREREGRRQREERERGFSHACLL